MNKQHVSLQFFFQILHILGNPSISLDPWTPCRNPRLKQSSQLQDVSDFAIVLGCAETVPKRSIEIVQNKWPSLYKTKKFNMELENNSFLKESPLTKGQFWLLILLGSQTIDAHLQNCPSNYKHTLPKTNFSTPPKKACLGNYFLLWGFGLFSGASWGFMHSSHWHSTSFIHTFILSKTI